MYILHSAINEAAICIPFGSVCTELCLVEYFLLCLHLNGHVVFVKLGFYCRLVTHQRQFAIAKNREKMRRKVLTNRIVKYVIPRHRNLEN